MKRTLICLFLSAALLLTAFSAILVPVKADSVLTTSEECISLLKEMEGFASKPYWDYSQYSVGYGTRCPDEHFDRYMSEGIPEEEATALLQEYVAISEEWINNLAEKYAVTFNQGQFDALVLFTYNCGTRWMGKSGLFRDAVINGATGNEFLYAMSLWCSAGGQINSYLLDRRLKEARIYLEGVYSYDVPENYGYVFYDANGGELDYRVQGFDKTNPPVPFVNVSHPEWEFLGWFTAADGGTQITTLDGQLHGATLYAHWNKPATDTTDPSAPEGTDPEATTPTVPESEITETKISIKVTGDAVNVRSGPGTGYPVLSTVRSGTELLITQTTEGSGYTWGKHANGWICLKYTSFSNLVAGTKPSEPTTPDTPAAPLTGTIECDTILRVRSGPGTSYSILGYLSNGSKVTILSQQTVDSTVWGQLENGWISMEYVKLDETDSGNDSTTDTTTPTTPPDNSGVIATGKVINTDNLRVRSGAGTDNEVVAFLSHGTVVSIYEKVTVGSMEWGRIDQGWISLDYVAFDSDTPTVIETGTVVNTNSLRIRSAAGTENTVLGYLTMGTTVNIYEKLTVGDMVWARIDQGWVSMDYIKVSSSAASSSASKTVNTSSLRIRSAAGTDNSIVGFLTMGERVAILEVATESGVAWGRINSGWICMDYVV